MFNTGFGNTGFGGQQPQQNTGFGSGQNAFGSTAGSFGAPATGFGAAANTGFGGVAQNTGFGAAPAANAFGAAPASTGFGGGGFGATNTGFGVQAQTQPQTGFGGPSFGAANTSTATGGFGGFGSNTATTSGFGSGAGFGAKPATTGFGAQPTTGFGATANTGFGATNAFGGGGMLGAGLNAPGGQGTMTPAFSPFVEKEPATGQNSHYQSITAMPAYRGYSFEELRLQDYQQGRKFPGQGAGFGGATAGFGQQQQQQPAATGFGAPAATGFGATNTATSLGGFGGGSTGFGGAATSGFGSTTGFGATAPATTGFGATAAAPTTGFGANTSAFGGQSTTGFGSAPGATGFGATGGFGAATAAKPATGFGGFGAIATSQPATGFGATPGGFGASSAAPSLFGNTGAGATTGFGAAPTAGATTGFGGFGATQTSAAPASTGLGFGLGGGTGAFGTAAKPAGGSLFGNPATSSAAAPAFGGFGATPASGGGGLFGNTSSGSSLFPAASTASTAKPATTGLFGQQPTTGFGTGTGFGMTSTAQPSSLFGGAGATNTGFGSSLLGGSTFGSSINTAAAQPTLVASVSGNIYGDNPLFQRDNTAPLSKSQPAVLSRAEPSQKLPALIPPVRFNPRHSQIRLRPTSTATFSSSVSGGDLAAGRKSLLLLDGINDDSSYPADEYASRRSVKKLQLKPRGAELDQTSFALNNSQRTGVSFNSALEYAAAESIHKPAFGQDRSPAVNGRLGESQSHLTSSRNESSSATNKPSRVDGEYWTSPALEDLRKMSQAELQHVEGFKVGLPGYGSVSFQQPVDLTTVPSLSAICGNIVVFGNRVCNVYPNESNKPPRGQGMNVPAIISLEACWPKDKTTGEAVKFDRISPMYAAHVKRLKRQAETTFIDFSPEDGRWTFRVEHFSEYGLTDDEDDETHAAPSHAESRAIPAAAEHLQMESDDQLKYYPESSQSSHASGSWNAPSRSSTRYQKNVDPQRLNMMRTSLFADTYPKQDRLAKRSSVWSTSSENTEPMDSAGEHAGGFEAEVRPSFQQEYDVRESLLKRPPRKFTRSSYEQSLLTRKGNLLADAGLMMGRSCRVGWGPNGTLAVCGRICRFEDVKEGARAEKDSVQQRTYAASPSTVELLKIRPIAGSEDIAIRQHVVSLQALLKSTTITLDQNNEPRASIVPGTTFTTMMNHLKEFHHDLSAEEVNAWILGQSLFDPQPTPPNMSQMAASAQESYELIGRRVRCGNWLSYVTKSLLDADMHRVEVEGGAMAPEETIFTMLLNNKRQKASVAAVRSKNLRLATLISQSGRGSRPLTGVEDQMVLYKTIGTDGRIPVSYLKVYALLCGQLGANIAPQGEPSRSVTHGLDWRRTFGLYLWYSNTPGANLKEAVDAYTLGMAESKAVARPRPWYQQGQTQTDPSHFDFLFQLIALRTIPSKSLEDVLHPLGMSPSGLDYRQSWLFYTILTQSLRISRFRSALSHAKICQYFMFQLESLGLWEWAVFVALHLETAASREVAVRQILERHVDIPAGQSGFSAERDPTPAEMDHWASEFEKTSFLCKELRVPETWLWIARATRARYVGALNWEVFSLLKGGEHQQGHDLILSRLAPQFILHGDLSTLGFLLGKIDQNKVADWETGGAIYQKFLDCCSDYEGSMSQLRLKSKVSYANDLVPEQDIQALQVEVHELMRRLPLLLQGARQGQKELSPLLELCVTEMASKGTTLLRDLKDLSIQESASLADLPMTEDMRMSTVQKISTDYFDEILKYAEAASH
ncbi:hypothetical protein BGZ98_004947 [Dissophora globulifera]|nr:hypothetical protein BGZ98_004947 [Dissophora globulifera]